MKAFSDPEPHQRFRTGLILLFVGEVAVAECGQAVVDDCDHFSNMPDEHNQADILTPGINLAPAFPIEDQWRIGSS